MEKIQLRLILLVVVVLAVLCFGLYFNILPTYDEPPKILQMWSDSLPLDTEWKRLCVNASDDKAVKGAIFTVSNTSSMIELLTEEKFASLCTVVRLQPGTYEWRVKVLDNTDQFVEGVSEVEI